MRATISVIIPTHNYGRFIPDAIASVLTQTLPADEIVVVDDGSTDNTAAVVASFGSSVKYLWQEQMGVSAARNRGVDESKGDLIAFLDADDTWEPEKLEMQAAAFATDTAVGLVHCGMREFDSLTGETLSLHLNGCAGHVANNLLLWEEPLIVGPGGTIMVTRSAFDEAGGYDPRIAVGEDWDLCYRIARRYAVRFVARPLVNYRNHGAAAHLNIRAMERGMKMFYQKAFAEGGDILMIRNRAMGNYHKILAGSYFQAGMYLDFLKHGLLSVAKRPSNVMHLLRLPSRRFAARRSA
jgi:glycosyltransferase involved in cell wall biosynthesis